MRPCGVGAPKAYWREKLRCGIFYRVQRTTDIISKTLSQVGERPLIELLRQGAALCPDVVVGIGDACAVVRISPDAAEDIVLKSDPIIRGRHFLGDAPPELVGRKAVGRVLSDIASMGSTPRWLLVDLVAPGDTPLGYITAVFKGMNAVAAEYGCAIVGGDTCKSGELHLHVFCCGTLPRGSARLRSGARQGDVIRVTGELGGSLASGRHLSFSPRMVEGQWLRDRVNSMIDISDGLSSELWHIAHESKASLVLSADAVPLSATAAADASPLDRALYDGEDFELLFTLPAENDPEFDVEWRRRFPGLKCTRIGEVVSTGTAGVVFTDGARVPERGYDHFEKEGCKE